MATTEHFKKKGVVGAIITDKHFVSTITAQNQLLYVDVSVTMRDIDDNLYEVYRITRKAKPLGSMVGPKGAVLQMREAVSGGVGREFIYELDQYRGRLKIMNIGRITHKANDGLRGKRPYLKYESKKFDHKRYVVTIQPSVASVGYTLNTVVVANNKDHAVYVAKQDIEGIFKRARKAVKKAIAELCAA